MILREKFEKIMNYKIFNNYFLIVLVLVLAFLLITLAGNVNKLSQKNRGMDEKISTTITDIDNKKREFNELINMDDIYLKAMEEYGMSLPNNDTIIIIETDKDQNKKWEEKKEKSFLSFFDFMSLF